MTKDAVEKLKRNNQELLEIINNSWDGIGIIDKNTNFIYVNNAFMPILGFSKEELLKIDFLSLMEEKYKNEFSKLLIVENQEKKYKAEIDITCIRKDFKRVYLKITISTMLNKNLFVVNIKDITSQSSDDEILDDYVLSMHYDLHGHVTKVSSAFLKLTKYNENDILGKPFFLIAHKDSNEVIYKNMLASLENFYEWNGKVKKVKKDNTVFWLDVKAKAIFNKYGDVTGYTALMFDITNELTLNSQSTLLQEQVILAKEELSEKNKLLAQKSKLAVMTETLQVLSHEWRQPLNLISLKAQSLELKYLMNEKLQVDEALNSLGNIKDSANKLSQTIKNFQRFIEPTNQKNITTITKIIENAIEVLIKEQDLSNIIIQKNINSKNNLKLYDEEICEVLVLILKNSIEAFKDLNQKEKVIKIDQYLSDDKIIFEISDNAKGFDEDIIHKVFEPYFSTKEEKQGVGLGLYMSKTIINIRFNGIITASNNKTGATIKISIPID